MGISSSMISGAIPRENYLSTQKIPKKKSKKSEILENSTSFNRNTRLENKENNINYNNCNKNNDEINKNNKNVKNKYENNKISELTQSSEAISRCPFLQSTNNNDQAIRKFIKLNNIESGHEIYDTLHLKGHLKHIQNQQSCTDSVCMGSVMVGGNFVSTKRTTKDKSEILREATDFLDEYYKNKKCYMSVEHVTRLEEVQYKVKVYGKYYQTEDELMFGARLAWRNASRCIGRIQWSNLKLFDYRHVRTAAEMFEAVCHHIEYATNGGNIRSCIVLFPQRVENEIDYRIWNSQLISYAGYTDENGNTIGDPLNVEFTEFCLSLGWQSKRTEWDILPMVLSAGDGIPHLFEYPDELILQVPLVHPKYKWFEELNLRWYGVPAVSNMMFDCGGIEFPACAFNGWYMSTEIGCRNLCDANRRNLSEKIGLKLNLDTNSPISLWKDQTLVEINIAVLYSFQLKNVTIVDHHTASDSFIKHMENETKLRKGCPADWVWIVPPMSSSLTPVFHQEMVLYFLKPSFEYQVSPLKLWQNRHPRHKIKFRTIARVIFFASVLYKKVLSSRIKTTILFATETGKSEQFAQQLNKLFQIGFNTQVLCMEEYDINSIEDESIILIVASTFGNGEPPENGKKFKQNLYKMMTATNCQKQIDGINNIRNMSLKTTEDFSISDFGPLRNIRYAVFALGSSSYPNFCAYGKYLDTLMDDLGGDRIRAVTCGDELSGQEKTFKKWSLEIFKQSCNEYNLTINNKVIERLTNETPINVNTIRTIPVTAAEDKSIEKQLAVFHNRNNIFIGKMKTRASKLHLSNKDNKSTIYVRIETNGEQYEPGDHVGIFPQNPEHSVNELINRLCPNVNCDEVIRIEVLETKGISKNWKPHQKLPVTTIRILLTRFLDIMSIPSIDIMDLLQQFCSDANEKKRLNNLIQNQQEYEKWRNSRCSSLLDLLREFPTCKPPVTLLLISLKPLQPRYYSISSSPDMFSKEIQLTVGVLRYQTEDENGVITKHYGVCSNYLKSLNANTNLYLFIRKAESFHLPKDSTKPIILIGPGTGIAPFRSFWQHLEIQQKNTAQRTKVWLFFGCQTREIDLYAEEKKHLLNNKILNRVFNAWSREPDLPKTYVQDLIKSESESIYNMIVTEGGHIYVCGDATMAENVYQTIRNILKPANEDINGNNTIDYMQLLKEENRYHEDIFGNLTVQQKVSQ